MGYMRHHAIVVTSIDAAALRVAHNVALRVFGAADPLGRTFAGLVTPVVGSVTNGFQSFMVGPDGSKEGWDTSAHGDACRREYIDWLDDQRYSDDSSRYSWVEVQYGDDNLDTRILADSDAYRRSRRA